MIIKNNNQYNQGIGKYKVLSSTAGVGAIVPTTWGGFIMPLSIDKWQMIKSYIEQRGAHPEDTIERIAEDSKCILVTDQRFVEYLKSIQQLPNLEALIAVPHLILSDYNYCDYKSHPLFTKWSKTHPRQRDERETDTNGNLRYISRFLTDHGDTLTIPAIVFPRWFRSKNELKPVEQWKEKWDTDIQSFKRQQISLQHTIKDSYPFVQPVECKKTNNGQTIMANKVTKNGADTYYPEVIPLEQVPMVLICPNGHISDIPWDKYFAFKLANGRQLSGDDYKGLFQEDANTCNNGQPHKLQWIPNRSNPDSYGTLHCTECGGRVSLEGIMNIRPDCPGEKPWIGNPADPNDRDARENCDQTMRWALVTSNSVYYAESFNSIYIPDALLSGQLSSELKEIKNKLVEKHKKWQESNAKDKDFFEWFIFPHIVEDEVESYNDENDDEDQIASNEGLVQELINTFKLQIDENIINKNSRKIFKRLNKQYGGNLGNNAIKLLCIKLGMYVTISLNDSEEILKSFEQGPQDEMTPEKYRYDEYKVFMETDSYRDPEDKYLCFNDIDLGQMGENVNQYFSKIKQFSNLAVSTTQLQFTRASNEDTDDGQNGNEAVYQKIFDRNRNEVLALPANQNFGEGLFFALNEDMVHEFCDQNDIMDRYQNIVHRGLGQNLKTQMDQYGAAKFYLLHTFAHIIMKELEFSCGYPTASLQERLYYSDRMCGVLIYTADGSEGSMGGLVAQGFPKTIEKIIKKAVERAVDCSSDPLCWEHTVDQLNLAACFSCCMVSETSCEYFNMGLDRRALVDGEFGYFKEMI